MYIYINKYIYIYRCNRSAALLNADKVMESLRDARTSKLLDSKYYKAAYREGIALEKLSRFEEAAVAFCDASTIIQSTLAVDLTLLNKMKQLMLENINKAKEQYKSIKK